MRLVRVFPRRTKATPDDELAYSPRPGRGHLDAGPGLFPPEADEVHISVTFTADKPKAEDLAEVWRHVAPVKIGGVAYGDEGRGYFTPGKYIKHGYTFTSRGCPRRCWFCSVWKRRPKPVPIWPFAAGNNILDDNLLACPDWHVGAVFQMLALQKPGPVHFTGGLEALSLTDYHVGLLADLKPRPACFFAYDPGDPYETLESAARRMLAAGFTRESHLLRCYVLIGYPNDSLKLAEFRLRDMRRLGFTPYAMLWEPETPAAEKHRPKPEWRAFQRRWLRPAFIHHQAQEIDAPKIQRRLFA